MSRSLGLWISFALLCSGPLAAQTLVANGNSVIGTSAIRPPAGLPTVAFYRTAPGGQPPFGTTSGVATLRSVDEGASWWLNTRPSSDTIRWESQGKLLADGNGGCVLFYYGTTNVGISNFISEYRRWSSTDCITFNNQATLSGLGSRPSGGAQFAGPANGVFTTVYQDTTAVPNGAYLTQSTDGGLTWQAEHTLVAAGVITGLLYRSSDQRYFASYNESGRLWVKSSGSGGARDWATTAVNVFTATSSTAVFTLLADDSLLMTWSVGAVGHYDIWGARSADGVNWSSPFALKNSPADDETGPFALAGATPDTFTLYWSSRPAGTNGDYSLYTQTMQLPGDGIYADGFELP